MASPQLPHTNLLDTVKTNGLSFLKSLNKCQNSQISNFLKVVWLV